MLQFTSNRVIIHLESCCNSQVNGLNDTAHSIEQIEWLEQLEAAATLPGSEQRWEDELWARQELSDSPITTAAHEFNCTSAARAMLAMYGPLNYRTAARTLFLGPYLAHFCPVFSRFFAVFSVLTPGFQKVAPEDRGPVP